MELFLDPGRRGTLAAQLYAQLREAIATGRLAAGDRLPPSRTLAGDLGVSRFTVAEVYSRLTAEGYVTAEQLRLEKIGQGEGEAARARLTGIKEAQADNNVLVVEYLQALERIGDGRATKLVIPAEFSGLLGTVAAVTDVARSEDGGDEVRPKRGLPIPETAERVDAPAPRDGGRR